MNENNFQQKMKAYNQDSNIKALREHEKTSLVFIILWKLGVKIKPPVFMSNMEILTVHAIVAWVLMSLVMVPLYISLPEGTYNSKTLFGLFICGIVFGVKSLIFLVRGKKLAKEKNLSWDEY